MEGPGGDPGVTPRAVERLFAHAAELSALGSSFEFEVPREVEATTRRCPQHPTDAASPHSAHCRTVAAAI